MTNEKWHEPITRNMLKYGSLIAILIILTISLSTTAFAALPSYVNAYGQTPFEEAYSNGYINIWQTTSWGSGVTAASLHSNKSQQLLGSGFYNDRRNWPDQYVFWSTNRERRDDVYLDHPGGAIMDGIAYDVREYVWITGSTQRQYWYILLDGYCFHTAEGEGSNQTNREFHFYQAGHCGDPNYEVTFRGIMTCRDLDGDSWTKEGYSINQGFRGVWATTATTVGFDSESRYHGTGAAEQQDNNDGVWVQFESSPGAPLVFQYRTTAIAYGSPINFWGNSINYTIVDVGWGLPSGAGSFTRGAAAYGTYRFMTASAMPFYDTWEFRGWYWDSGLTNPVPETQVITSDLTVYGTYVRTVFPVTTSVTNGSITPTNNEVRAGTDYTVYYSPNSGYLLTSVVVDGSNVSIESYPDSYTFNYLSSAHSVAVTYVAPSASKSWA